MELKEFSGSSKKKIIKNKIMTNLSNVRFETEQLQIQAAVFSQELWLRWILQPF